MTISTDLSSNFQDWLKATYKELHQHPELGMDVRWTTSYVKKEGRKLGLSSIDLPGLDTGAVYVIKGSQPGRTIALRADMDALPIEEKAPVEYRSKVKDVMHACGHDLNTTVMLGVLRRVVEEHLAADMKGSIKFIFQPGEETLQGAKAMISAGVLHNPDVDIALMSHGDPDLHVGEIALFEGYSHANSDEFSVEFHGQGGHGSRPYQTQDLILAGAYLINIFQSIVSRDVDARDVAVLSVCSFNAGSASNVIPSYAKLTGTVRTLKTSVQDKVRSRMQEACDAMAALFHMKADFKYQVGAPSCPIDSAAENILRSAALKVLPPENIIDSKTRMGGEDFSFIAREVPSGVMRLGITTPGEKRKGTTHSSTFQPDLDALTIGVDIITQAVKDFFAL